jgi:antitoxin VapB
MTQTAKIFKNGRSQAVRLPAEFRFDTKEVYIRRDPATGDIVLSAKRDKKNTWEEFIRLRDKLLSEGLVIPDDFPYSDKEMDSVQSRDPFEGWEE